MTNEQILAERNAELEKELATKNHELEIEAALERVRTVAMSMGKADDLLSICEILFHELQKLGFSELRNAMINIHDDNRGSFLNHDYSDEIGKSITTVFYSAHSFIENQLKQVRSANDAFSETILTGKELNDWIEVRRRNGEKDDPRLENAGSLYYYFYSIGVGAIGISTLSCIGEKKLDLLKRFRNVFNLSYQRYIDIAHAEAQAKESQIQLALERVRARTMAMQKSDELSDAVYVLFQQFKELGENPDQATIGIINEDEKVIDYWVTMHGQSINKMFKFSIDEPNVTNKIYKGWKENKRSLAIDLSGKALAEFMAYRASKGGAAVNPNEKRRIINIAFFSKGLLNVQSNEERSEESIKLLERFAAVFDQTYTRFLDLQKAEAQVREAQIEAALERVRSRSMAMHQSSDLHEVVKVVTEQLLGLGIKFNVANFASIHSSGGWDLWVSAPDQAYPAVMEVPYLDHGLFNNIVEAIRDGRDFVTDVYDQDEKNIFFKHFFENTVAKYTPDARKEWVMNCKGFARSVFLTKNIWLAVSNYDGIPFSKEENTIFKRFANVFEQAYTRFLDLEKAEAQTRESQIQLALERARAQSMMMQHSTELDDTLRVFHEQVLQLGIPSAFSFLWLPDEEKDRHIFWAAWAENNSFESKAINYPLDRNEPATAQCLVDWKSNQAVVAYHVPREGVLNYFNAWSELIAGVEQLKPGYFSDGLYYVEAFMKYGCFGVMVKNALHEDEKKILERFAIEFERAYTRFLDLQKAEEQAREAQIEAALERVRSSTMAMHKSEDLAKTAAVLFEQLSVLGNTPDRLSIGIINESAGKADMWLTDQSGNEINSRFIIDLDEKTTIQKLVQGWKAGVRSMTVDLTGDELKVWLNYVRKIGLVVKDEHFKNRRVHNVAFFSHGWLNISTLELLPKNMMNILERFATVYSLTYRRFLDLQKAEAQAREAEIELGLERVRARTMAMQHQNDLLGVTDLFAEQLIHLGVDLEIVNFSNGLGYGDWDLWVTSHTSETVRATNHMVIPWIDHPYFQKTKIGLDNFKKGIDLNVAIFSRAEKDSFLDHVFAHTIFKDFTNEAKDYLYNKPGFTFSTIFLKETWVSICKYDTSPFTNEQHSILKRFANTFGQAYTRFLDLQKAEAQAREAQIEAALERVRSKVMSMRSSEDLNETIKVFYHQLESLSLTPRRCGVGLLNKENRIAELSTINTTADGHSIDIIGKLEMTMHPVLEGVYNGWLKQEEYHPVLRGNEIKEYYKILRPQIQFPDYTDDAIQYGYFFFFDEGGVYAWTEKQMEETELQIYRRFTSVLNLTYKRYKDLKQAESNAREAVKQAALDRIRADIASMRSVSDLDRITPLIWNELTILGIPFIRCGVFLMDDALQFIHTFLSAPDGKAIAAFHMPYDTPGNLGKVLNHWQEKKNYIDHWSENEFMSLADILVKQGSIVNREEYLASLPRGGFHLHFLPFLQGMLYVGNTTQLSEEEIKLLQSVADAFSTAYARYEDFNKLEAAKKQVDSTLNELQATQKQLIQSEKMASLGELTAGIAHEIQNPLNFVNNFSEVSNEMIDELQAERSKLQAERDEALEDEIINDIKQNLEKINYHGKRADAIVKGMLQHSRTSTGQKEPTNINALCDEYLRLSYHGLRAKDKSFNADFKTDFDESIGKINIVPQDMGRVLLNLFNNAFYAVNEKKKSYELSAMNYEPLVSVQTKRAGYKVEIRISDNGKGIPQNIIDKIFQPFFTTKPTGQGTGLGLSLAYDIINAHEGEIKVETKEGEETAFIISLPVA